MEYDMDLVPMTFLRVSSIQGVQHDKALTVLLDSGSKTSWFSRRALPPGVFGTTVQTVEGATMAGTFRSNREVTLTNLVLPELCLNATLPEATARIFNADCRYDIILGRDMCRAFRIRLDFDNDKILIGSKAHPMRVFPSVSSDKYSELGDQLQLDHMDSHLFSMKSSPSLVHNDEASTPMEPSDTEPVLALDDSENDSFASSSSQIKDADYDSVDVADVVRSCTHLSQQQQNSLFEILSKHSKLFDNELKVFPDEQISLDIDPSVPPSQSRAYPVPHSHLDVFKKELDRLVKIGVLERTGRSSWISGSFIIPKADGTVRWISDFRALNKAIKRRVYPIPRIQDVLATRRRYSFLSKLDISMGYYTFELDETSRNLTTIATPFGLYRYCRLPMGVSQSPDIFQEKMESVLQDIEDLVVYMDDILLCSGNFQDHMHLLDKVLQRLEDHGFTVNPRKCEWGVQETHFLGHWLTPTGVKPWTKKVDAIIAMQAPTNTSELRAFLGLVTYYRDMWPRRSHILSPLTEILKNNRKKKAKISDWTPQCQKAFEAMKALAASNALLLYPDHNKPFEIETDASDFQLGAVIKQGGRPVAYYTRKLNSAQKNYTTIEKELLSIVETLKEFRSMLLGAEIKIYTDHKNLTHRMSQFTTQRVLRWRLLLEEYSPTFLYIKGASNVVADALSRVPTSLASAITSIPTTQPVRDTRSEDAKLDDLYTSLRALPWSEAQAERQYLEEDRSAEETVSQDDLFMFLPKFDAQNRAPFRFATIAYYQQRDDVCQQRHRQEPFKFFLHKLGGHEIICTRQYPRLDSPWKIVLPDNMLMPMAKWYHDLSAHSYGQERLENVIRRNFWNPQLREACRHVVSNCTICPQVRVPGRQYGELAPREVLIAPWSEVHLDFIGPWKIPLNGQTLEFNALTMLDPVTNLLEIVRLPTGASKNGENSARLFSNHWLSRYPRPATVVTDNGPEFMNHVFQFGIAYEQVKPKRISPNTPTANALIETTHLAIGQILRTYLLQNPPSTLREAETVLDDAVASAIHAFRCAPNAALGHFSPGAVVFQRDMLLDMPLISDILTLSRQRQAQVDNRLIRANRGRIRHEFKVGQKVFIKVHDRTSKLAMVRVGPFPILQVHTNNTVTVQRGQIHERISIRHLVPLRPSPAPKPRPYEPV